MSPDVTMLIRHLSEIPEIFRKPIRTTNETTGVHVPAVLSDLIHSLTGDFKDPTMFQEFMPGKDKKSENHARACLYTAHILHHPFFKGKRGLAEKIPGFLGSKLKRIATLIQTETFLSEPDRREELVRHCIALTGLPPAGETATIAHDRLTTLDTVERQRVIQESFLAEKRARELREAIARKEAEEAASKWSRE